MSDHKLQRFVVAQSVPLPHYGSYQDIFIGEIVSSQAKPSNSIATRDYKKAETEHWKQ